MNTDAQRERNARKRAKLRAKSRGETSFSHVYLDAFVEGCDKLAPHPEVESLAELESLPWEFAACTQCTDPFCFNKGKPGSKLLFTSLNFVVLGGLEESSAALEAEIERFLTRVKGLGQGIHICYTFAWTSQGQRSVKEWHETTEVGVADVIAAISTLALFPNPVIS